jgi:hypothetical protein
VFAHACIAPVDGITVEHFPFGQLSALAQLNRGRSISRGHSHTPSRDGQAGMDLPQISDIKTPVILAPHLYIPLFLCSASCAAPLIANDPEQQVAVGRASRPSHSGRCLGRGGIEASIRYVVIATF